MNLNIQHESKILLQSMTRAISHDQLIVKIKNIYVDLIMLKIKCLEINEKHFMKIQKKILFCQTKSNSKQWQILIVLHKLLLHEHHDFFVIFQHFFANSALNQLIIKYSMFAKMWRHDIHVFLKIFRYELSEILNHMLIFIYCAYSMIILFFEIVSIFEIIWTKCFGDLKKYRMTIKYENFMNRNV